MTGRKPKDFAGRVRKIRPEIFTDERFADIDGGDQLLFMGLLVFSSLTGELPDDPDRVRRAVYPCQADFDADRGLAELERVKLIARFNRDGDRLIQIIGLSDFIQVKSPVTNHAHEARRRARKRQAMPIWADQVRIKQIYCEAKRRIKETGESWHVDHIIPLAGKRVCGLHVPENLQIIPGPDNMKKSNKFDANAP